MIQVDNPHSLTYDSSGARTARSTRLVPRRARQFYTLLWPERLRQDDYAALRGGTRAPGWGVIRIAASRYLPLATRMGPPNRREIGMVFQS